MTRSKKPKKPIPITSSINKPTKKFKSKISRKIINSFHLLLKSKTLVLKKTSLPTDYLPVLQNNKKWLGHYDEGFNEHQKSKKIEIRKDLIPKINSTKDVLSLIKILGEIDKQIELQGGLNNYQKASLIGQDKNRGSDSSKKLIEWFKEIKNFEFLNLNVLEIGSLSSNNEISKYFSKIKRIDLNSQELDKIEQIDFMKFPIDPNYDIISLSLVLNFVPNEVDRGEMLKRLSFFFKNGTGWLFFVLPLSCIENSKYIDKDVLINKIFKNLGYELINFYESNKLVYCLFKFDKENQVENLKFKKVKLIGNLSNKNNFSIVLN